MSELDKSKEFENHLNHEPAFPTDVWNESQSGFFQEGTNPGMTLRDYFAAKFMQGSESNGTSMSYKSVARNAYEMADEMLRAREN